MKNSRLNYTVAMMCSLLLLSSCGKDSEQSSTSEISDAVTSSVSETSAETTVSESTASSQNDAAVTTTAVSETSESVSSVTAAETAVSSKETEKKENPDSPASPSASPEDNGSGAVAPDHHDDHGPSSGSGSEPESRPQEDENGEVSVTLNGSSAECSSSRVSINGSSVTVTAEGVYRFSGSLNGEIIVAAPKDAKVDIELCGVSISNSNGPALRVDSADKVKIITSPGSDNTLSDGGSSEAALYSKEDLTLKGDGTLRIHGNVKNAVYSKNTLKVTGGTYDITSANNGLTGKDKVNIENGNITVNCSRDAVKATNETEDGKGVVTVTGGTLNLTAGDDGIQAIRGVTVTGCSITVKCEGKKVNCDAGVQVDDGCITKIKGD